MQEPTTASLDPTIEPRAAAGLTVGIVVSAGVAIVGLVDESWSIAIGVGLLGIPSAAILGWRFGPRVRGAPIGEAARIVVKMGVLASFGSALTISGLVFMGTASGGDLTGIVVLPYALLFAIPALVITIPAALVWVVVMRLLMGRGT